MCNRGRQLAVRRVRDVDGEFPERSDAARFQLELMDERVTVSLVGGSRYSVPHDHHTVVPLPFLVTRNGHVIEPAAEQRFAPTCSTCAHLLHHR